MACVVRSFARVLAVLSLIGGLCPQAFAQAVPRDALVLADIRPCGPIPLRGATCDYSVEIRNTTDAPLEGLAFSTLQDVLSGVFAEISTDGGDGDVKRVRLHLPPHGSQRVAFSFDAPSIAPESFSWLCPSLQIALDPEPLFGLVVAEELFCVLRDRRLDAVDVDPPAARVLIEDVRPCPPIGSAGGRCEYSAALRNTSESSVSGIARLVVDDLSGPVFEASTRTGDPAQVRRARVFLPGLESRRVSFAFDVPASVADGTRICPVLYFGEQPFPLFDTRLADYGTCLVKGERPPHGE